LVEEVVVVLIGVALDVKGDGELSETRSIEELDGAKSGERLQLDIINFISELNWPAMPG
jgi:hypothetical protein